MGGGVNVIVREKDGNISKMCRWTNSLKGYLHSPEFVKDPDSLLKKYIKAGEVSDYNHDNVKFAPDGYGLIVIDAVNEVILSYQDYTNLDLVVGASYCLSLKVHQALNFSLKDSPIPFIDSQKFKDEDFQDQTMSILLGGDASSANEEWQTARDNFEFFMMGCIGGSERILKKYEKGLKNKTISWFEVLKYRRICKRLQGNPRTVDDWKFFLKTITKSNNSDLFEIKMGNYQIIDFGNDAEDPAVSFLKYQEKLKELGFVLSQEDLSDWKDYLKMLIGI